MTHDTEVAAERGEFHFPLDRAALCAEPECNRVFALPVRSSSDGRHCCPACGGSHFIQLDGALRASGETRQMLMDRVESVEGALARLVAKTMAIRGSNGATKNTRIGAAINEAARAALLFEEVEP